jgi:hypothetical protein
MSTPMTYQLTSGDTIVRLSDNAYIPHDLPISDNTYIPQKYIKF